MQEIANTLPIDLMMQLNITKLHVPVINASARISVHVGQSQNMAVNEYVPNQKRGRPIGSKDSTL